MKITNKRITSLAMILVVMVVLVLSITSEENLKRIPIKSTYEIDKLVKVCYINCNGVKEYNYNSIIVDLEAIQQKVNMIAEEKRQAELAVEAELVRIAEAERKERARLAKVELDKQREIRREEKKMQPVIASRSQGYQSNYEMTFYTAFCPTGCTGKTASSYNVSNTIYYKGLRIVAAPPSIPLYTKLKITFEDGRRIDAIVLDRGGAIQGKRILDLLVETREEAYRLGRQQVKVEVVQ